MTAAERLANKLRLLVEEAWRHDLIVVADSETPAIRLITRAESESAADLRGLGVQVRVPNGCGSGSSAVGGDPITHGAGG